MLEENGDIVKVLKESKCEPVILYQVRLPFTRKGHKQVTSMRELGDYSHELFLRKLQNQWFSKCGPKTSSVSNTCKLVGNVSSWAPAKPK